MPTDNEYALQDLADLAGVTPRTVRFYIAQGLLPSPGRPGPGASYGEGHLARLRLIRQLQREHLPLADIRARLTGLDDEAVAELVDETASPGPLPDSAADYIRRVLAGGASEAPAAAAPLMRRSTGISTFAGPAFLTADAFEVAAPPASPKPASEPPFPDRSQWDRIVLVPDVELHVRRPLSRHVNKRVERLVAIARELLEEDPS